MADERTGESLTTNYGWTMPVVGGSGDAWGDFINADLVGIDSTVHSVQTSVPAASSTAPVMDGTAAAGTGTTYARADHIHPSDTSRYAASNPNGYQTAANVASAVAGYLPLGGGTITGSLVVNAAATIGGNLVTNASFQVNSPAGTAHNYTGESGGLLRWVMRLGNGLAEGGANAGSDLDFVAYADNGSTSLSAPLTMKRSTGVCTFSSAIVNGPSDRTLKENVAPLEGSLDKILALQGVSFNMISTPDKPEIGLIAQDVEPVVPEVVQTYAHTEQGKAAGDKMALDYPKLTALLIEAVKTLAARVTALEANG